MSVSVILDLVVLVFLCASIYLLWKGTKADEANRKTQRETSDAIFLSLSDSVETQVEFKARLDKFEVYSQGYTDDDYKMPKQVLAKVTQIANRVDELVEKLTEHKAEAMGALGELSEIISMNRAEAAAWVSDLKKKGV